MPGKVVKISTALKMRKGGVRRIKPKGKKARYQIRTESGHWKDVPKNAKVWHRGRGRWSHNTRKIDRQLPNAGSVEGKKRYGHTGDKPYSTKKKGARYGKAKQKKRKRIAGIVDWMRYA